MLRIVYWNALSIEGDGKEGQFIKVNYHIQSRHGIMINYWSKKVIELRPGFIKDRYPPKLGWPIEPMTQ